jgi:hypothetical protein
VSSRHPTSTMTWCTQGMTPRYLTTVVWGSSLLGYCPGAQDHLRHIEERRSWWEDGNPVASDADSNSSDRTFCTSGSAETVEEPCEGAVPEWCKTPSQPVPAALPNLTDSRCVKANPVLPQFILCCPRKFLGKTETGCKIWHGTVQTLTLPLPSHPLYLSPHRCVPAIWTTSTCMKAWPCATTLCLLFPEHLLGKTD